MPHTGRLTSAHGALLVVDLQERLLAPMECRDAVVAGCLRLVRGARLLNVPVSATEQYPKGLGPSVPGLVDLLPERAAKMTFHCCEVPGWLDGLRGGGIEHVTLAGIEAHVCVAQTAIELTRLGFVVQVAADAVASRHQVDYEFALRRLERAGATISTVEAILFEWAERADRPEFKALSALIKESNPVVPNPEPSVVAGAKT